MLYKIYTDVHCKFFNKTFKDEINAIPSALNADKVLHSY